MCENENYVLQMNYLFKQIQRNTTLKNMYFMFTNLRTLCMLTFRNACTGSHIWDFEDIQHTFDLRDMFFFKLIVILFNASIQ